LFKSVFNELIQLIRAPVNQQYLSIPSHPHISKNTTNIV